jgi:O-antigen/teichoic acid export membrane protein
MGAEQVQSLPKRHSLSRDFLWYVSGNVAVMAAGMLSLPITSRILSNYDFGVLGYYETLGTVWIALLKMGMQHSLLRFHPLHCLNKTQAEQQRFHATFIWYPALISVMMTAAAIFISMGLSRLNLVGQLPYLVATLVLSELSAIISFPQNLLAAERKSHAFAMTNAALRWLQLALVLPTILVLWRTVMGVFFARIAATGIIAVAIVFWLWKTAGLNLRSFTRDLFRQGLSFGIPLSLNEVAAMIHDQIDRVVLKSYLDFPAVGVYHINYSVASYLGLVLSTSFYPAFTPFANRTYDVKGVAAYREGARNVLRPLYYLAAAMISAVCSVGGDLCRLFIGAKADGRIFGIVAATYIMSPIANVLSHGLVLEKRGKTLMSTLIASCVVNLSANLVLIPTAGVMGAAYATLISFGFLFAARIILTPKNTMPDGYLVDCLRPAALGLLLYAGVTAVNRMLDLGMVTRLCAAAALFLVLFAIPSLLIDPALRKQGLSRLPKSLRDRLPA